MPLLYKLIREERCLSRWLENKITGANGKHKWNLHVIPHIILNGTIIGSAAAVVLVFLWTLRVI